jgi:hypothetical protein
MNEPFRLVNDPPKQPRGDFPGREPGQQAVLFTGLDLPANTRCLFETDYLPNERHESDAIAPASNSHLSFPGETNA